MQRVSYDFARSEMAVFAPAACESILDVGCATGKFGAVLRPRFPKATIWGIDIFPDSNAAGYDRVVEGIYPDDLPPGSFDCIFFNDVLEHMVDPWDCLERTRTRLNPGGAVVASVPSIRNLRTIGELLLAGDWRYRDRGVLDRTHLRFFTPRSMRRMFVEAGYEIRLMKPINLPTRGRRGMLIRATGRRIEPLLAEQWAVVAVPAGQSAEGRP